MQTIPVLENYATPEWVKDIKDTNWFAEAIEMLREPYSINNKGKNAFPINRDGVKINTIIQSFDDIEGFPSIAYTVTENDWSEHFITMKYDEGSWNYKIWVGSEKTHFSNQTDNTFFNQLLQETGLLLYGNKKNPTTNLKKLLTNILTTTRGNTTERKLSQTLLANAE